MSSIEPNERANGSEVHAVEKSSAENPPPCNSAPRWAGSSKAARVVAGIGIVAGSAAAFYRVRELLAMLLLFSALFAVVMAATLILWLIESVAHKAAVRLETQVEGFAARHVTESVTERRGSSLP